MARKHSERCKACKQRIFELLKVSFGNVEKQYNLNLPSNLEDYKGRSTFDDLAKIYDSL
jgi:hypothetical protein